jgi:large subunit ribosomal protein L18
MQKISAKLRRTKRVRGKIEGNKSIPRLTIYRSNKYIYAQLIDDVSGKSLCGISEKNISAKGTKSEKALELGKQIAKKALEQKIKKVVFDKGSYAYHGRVKQVAEGARMEGLQF